ncbi:MAG: HlyD family efflux transporter periplasmic adaptor subunit [Lewinellaceae bacterium]|nr:HlyD family efflux transporter periplasmic adaptor subunit [Saprospiraceae bacterium]MCB9339176.1 HlyD family efflux transporter periplasmic adaptor subunit [Lewinellaceae bacterium]
MEENNIELLSGEVKEILRRPPSSVITWGTAVLSISVLLIGITGYFYQYPETVKGEMILTTAVPPVPVRAPQTGYISELKVPENTIVSKGEILAVFASNADLADVLTLEKEVDVLSEFDFVTLQSYRPNPQLRVGELSAYYASVVSIFDYLSNTRSVSQGDQQLAVLEIQRHIQQLHNANRSLEKQKQTAQTEYDALKQEYNVAKYEYERTTDESKAPIQLNAYLKMSQKSNEISNIEAQMEANKGLIIEDNARIFEIQTQQQTGAKDKISQLKQNLGVLKSEIQRWKEKYLVVAPADGKVSFYAELTPKQLLTVGEEMLAIVPPSAEKNYIGEVKMPVEGSGKVAVGQPVNLMFDRYNFRELGLVKGRVAKIFPLMKGKTYSVEVELVNGLVTTKGHELEYHLEMGGQAEIVTADKSFVRRIFEKILGG